MWELICKIPMLRLANGKDLVLGHPEPSTPSERPCIFVIHTVQDVLPQRTYIYAKGSGAALPADARCGFVVVAVPLGSRPFFLCLCLRHACITLLDCAVVF